MVTIRIEKSRTIQTKPYESMKVSIAIEEEGISDDPEKVELTLNYWKGYIDSKLKDYGVNPNGT